MLARAAAAAPGSAGPCWGWEGAPVAALVRRVHELQAERARTFRRLDEALEQYARSGPPPDFPRYRRAVHEVTQAFTAASREVLALQAELAGPRAQPLLAGHVRRLQALEQTRLAAVAGLQLMGAPELAGQEDPQKMQELKTELRRTMEAISEVLQDLSCDAETAE